MSAEKPRTVIADDESHIRTLMKTVLKMMNFEVVAEAGNGQQAIDYFKELKPEITLLDVNMPMKTGLEALKEIKEIAPDACVIMLSSVSDMESVQEAIEMGASHFIRKDTPITEIKKIIAETWQNHQHS
ncbi:MAG: response regulator [Deltaproteobacteria bacterium HGW-Deltaproteobacteria-10]|nr:MAG: response regulator [Deltaproteobacteria bacterium HGW-Deltaproteobacteria-10]